MINIQRDKDNFLSLNRGNDKKAEWWRDWKFSVIKIFWSIELNDLWSKKICRPKMFVWSGDLRWSCFKGACAANFDFYCKLFVDWQSYLILQFRMVETSTIFLELRPEKYTSWCVILNSLLSRLSVLVAKFSYIGGSNSMSACLL